MVRRFSVSVSRRRRVCICRRSIVTIDRRQLQSLRLRDTDTGNRLTIDAGADRLDLARNAGEVEREWLYRTLAEKYGVSAATGDGGTRGSR